MTITKTERIKAYIAKIAPILEGERNDRLYRIGQKLRKLFGLKGDELLMWLNAINLEKCKPPLDDEEVIGIVSSIDKSDLTVDSDTIGRTVNISAIVDKSDTLDSRPCPIDEFLAKEVSRFSSSKTSIPSGTLTIGQFLDDCRNGKYQQLVEAIRAVPDKDKRNALKQRLPSVTIQSEVCERRGREFCRNNAILCLDFDDVEDVDKAKREIVTAPYVFAVFASAGDQGLYALAALAAPVEDLRRVLKEMQNDFDFRIDKACSDVSRLRYATSVITAYEANIIGGTNRNRKTSISILSFSKPTPNCAFGHIKILRNLPDVHKFGACHKKASCL